MLGEMKSFMGLGGGLIGKILVWKDGLEKRKKKKTLKAKTSKARGKGVDLP